MKTEMILYSGTERFNLDLTEDVSIPLTFNIDDIFKLGTRKTTWSKTITLPGTHNNNRAFNHIYKINSESSFDPRIKSRVLIKNSGIQAVDGTLSLDQIVKKLTSTIQDISYEVTVCGAGFEFFKALENKTLKDLDFSRYDHTLDLQTIRINWPSYFTGGGITAGMTYVTSNGLTTYTPNQTISYTAPPVLSINSVVFDGIARVNIVFTGNHSFSVDDDLFIDTDNTRLNGTHTIADIAAADEITLHMAYANLLTAVVSVGITVEKRRWDSFGYFYPMQDNGHYQKSLFEGTLQQSVLYTIVDLQPSDNFTNVCKDPQTGLPTAPVTGLTFLADDGITASNNPISPTIWDYGSELVTYCLKSDGGALDSKQSTVNAWNPTDLIPHIYAREVWQKLFELIGYDYDCPTIDSNLFRRLVMPLDSKINVEDIPGGPNTVFMNDWLPSMKLTDFFTSILNMFNLVIIEDPEIRTKINLVERNDFYNTETITWKVDASEPITIRLANSLLPSYYHFKYKDSSDFYNTDYNKEIGGIVNTSGLTNPIDRKYGDYYESTGNEFNDSANVIELSFEPTVMAGNITGVYDTSDKVISVTYSADDLGTNVTRKTANRILIAGFRGTDTPWTFAGSVGALTGESFDVTYGDFAGRFYPYAAHIDNVYDGSPRYDINFGALPGQYFPYVYDPTTWQEKTLVGVNWNRYLSDIISPHSRLVTGRFKLFITDIFKLDFRDLIRPENCDFVLKLSKITDWDVNGSGICTCEFLLKNI